jgi:carboxypeptidase T
MRRAIMMLSILLLASVPATSAQQPGIIQEHWYHSWATLTVDLDAWAADHPDIVKKTSAGETELGRDQWIVQISDWSNETKADGTEKDVVYIDGGHHGNEHLGTELAFLTAQYYIEGWAAGDEEAIRVLQNTELHIMVLLNADGNDMDTRWNVNQVDLNRNYDHHWNEQDETQPGSGPFSEAETANNAAYMNSVVPNADLYVTMHTGVWIMLHPWGYIPDQPIDWELFHGIRDDIHANISDIPVRNANQGLYPNSGTSRDYGYGIMGFPTFTFETDDEQFLLGSTEPLSSRLGEELEVMRYLIDNVWYWRARLVVDEIRIDEDKVSFDITNHGRATTRNATLQYMKGETIVWQSDNFTVNATNHTTVTSSGWSSSGGEWRLSYQKRIIDSAMWVNESVPSEDTSIVTQSGLFGDAFYVLQMSGITILAVLAAWWWSREEEPFSMIEPLLEAELMD